jgi:hypothetical protein
MARIQTQEEANAFWACHEVKKWVVVFFRGPQRRLQRREEYVAARHHIGAIRAARISADLNGHGWCKEALAQCRLATASDLGCVYVGEEGA